MLRQEVLLGELKPVIGPWKGMLERVITVDWMGNAYAGRGWIVYPLQSNDDLSEHPGDAVGFAWLG